MNSPPFDAKKYKALMGGLEAVEIRLKDAISVANEIRWESEYFKKEYLRMDNFLAKKQTVPFETLCSSIKKGIFDLSPELYKSTGVPFIRTSEIKKPNIDFSTTVFLDDKTNSENYKTVLTPYDLVFTKIGAYIGDVAILPSCCPYYNFSQNVAGASIKDKNSAPFYLAFFLSAFGRNQILRSSMLSGQGKLELADIRKYKIPVVSDIFKGSIKKIYDELERIQFQSVALYESAESLLLSALGLSNFAPSQDPIAIKTLSESLGTTGRLDAEYYRKKYDDLFQQLSYFNCAKLGDIVSIMKSIEPGSECYGNEGVSFVRVSDITKFGIQQPDIKIPVGVGQPDLYPKRNTILLSKDGSVGIAYKVEEDLTCVTSGALLHLTVKRDVLPDYLTLVLNSLIVQLQAERDAGGSVIQHWKPSEIAEVAIPILDIVTQRRISADVQRSFKLRRQSEQLLDLAKRAVETAIENDETAALKLLRSTKVKSEQ